MAKLVLNNIQNLQNESSVVTTLAQNNASIVAAVENTLSRDGTAPNIMGADFDMNGFDLINLPMATDPTSPVRLQEVGNAPALAAEAAASAAAALVSENNSAASAVVSTTQANISTAQAVISTTQATNASTSATNAATSETNAGASATAAAGSATTATTQAGIATTQAGLASTSAGTATTQAGIATTQAGNAASSATAAGTSATNAATSATQAQNYVVGLSGTSSTSLTIGVGSKSFTASTGKLWVAGQFLTAASNANNGNYMHGSVTSYNSSTGALVLNVLDSGGSGTLADWNITISGTQGPTGPAGSLGTTGSPTANQFATFSNSTTLQGVSVTGLVKGNGASAPTAAVASTDYIAATTGSAIQKASSGGLTAATAGTDYQSPIGTISGIAKGNGANALTAATAGTDYLAPAAIGVTVQGFDAQLFSNIPQNSQSAAYTLVATDAEKHIYHPSADTTARIFTIPANSSVAYPTGTALTFINDTSAGVITISITTDTMVLAGAGTTGSRTLAASGIATAVKTGSARWIINGTGLT